MNVVLRVAMVASVVALTGCSMGEDLKTLSSAEIGSLLKGNTITMESAFVAQSRPFRQYFGADGITVQVAEQKRTGKWHVGNNSFCVLWDILQKPVRNAKEAATPEADSNMNMKEACFQIKQDNQGKYKVYNANLGYVGTLIKITSGAPGKS